MLRFIVGVIFFLIFCLTVILILPNAQLMVELNYYTGHFSIHLIILLLFTLCLGAFSGILFNLLWVWRLRRDNQRLTKLYKQALREVDELLTHSTSHQESSHK
jgi:uncharacterized integral membrane protein